MDEYNPKPLLLTKLYLPAPRRQIVTRSHLYSYLDDCADCRLVLITAPAGFGKSTLVSSWLNKKKIKTAWISIDKNDNEPILFLSYIIEAFRQIEENIGIDALSSINSATPPPINIILTYLLNDLTALDAQCAVVFDDYHIIQNDEINQAMDFFIANAPKNIQFIVCSRQFPKLSLSKLRASNQILELNANHLRFTLDETKRFFENTLSWKLSQKDIVLLEEQTEGWVTGLQLAALGLKQEQNAKAFIQNFSGDDHLVADYLVDEVLSQMDIPLQNFLIRTSILNRFSASLCDYVLEIDNSQEILSYLEKENLFLISLDNQDNWFRYHHLFGDMLRSRLMQRTSDNLHDLYQRAVDWFVEHDLIEPAIDCALEAEHYESAAHLLIEHVGPPQTGLQQIRIQNWLQQIPVEILWSHNHLWLQLILSQFYFGDFSESLKMLEYYEQKISSSEEDELIQGIVVTLRGPVTLHTTMDALEVRRFTKQALEILPDDAYLVRGIAMGHYGSASLLLGELDVATSYLQDAIRMIEYTEQWPVVYVFRNYLAELIAVKGELHRAADYFKKIYTHANKRDVYNVFYSANLIGLGMIYYEWNLLEEARRYIEDGLQYIKSDKTIDRLLYAASACFRLDLANNELAKFETFINEIEEIAAKYDYPLRVMERIDSYYSLIALEKGDLNKAARWANIYAQHHKDDITCMRQREWLAVIRIWMKTGNETEAIEVLNKVHQLAHDEGRMRNWVAISAALSKAYHQIGDRSQAFSVLQAAIETAESEGYIRSFLDEGETIKDLLGEILEANQSSSLKQYIQQLLDAFPGEEYSKSKNLLTPREIDVVNLLSQGLTYDQIADELTISVNTLKYHIKNIFNKLEVHNRTEAVLIAKKFELI